LIKTEFSRKHVAVPYRSLEFGPVLLFRLVHERPKKMVEALLVGGAEAAASGQVPNADADQPAKG
jgi:hypothetical protein